MTMKFLVASLAATLCHSTAGSSAAAGPLTRRLAAGARSAAHGALPREDGTSEPADRVLRRLSEAVAGLTAGRLPVGTGGVDFEGAGWGSGDATPSETHGGFYKLASDGAHDFVYELVGREGLDELPQEFSF